MDEPVGKLDLYDKLLGMCFVLLLWVRANCFERGVVKQHHCS